MKNTTVIRTLATALLSLAALAGCSGAAEGSATQAGSVQDRSFGAEVADSADEPTPAERRLEWVRRPTNSQTAALDARLPADIASQKSR
jgi:hypothetical protein